MSIGMSESEIRATLPPIDGRGYDAHYYIWGKAYHRELDGGYRETFQHCGQDLEVWGPNALAPLDSRWRARCTRCKGHWQAPHLEGLWDVLHAENEKNE